MSPPRLTANSKAMKKLKQSLDAGILTGNETPKAVWTSDPMFQKFSLNTFRAAWYRIRKDYAGLPGRREEQNNEGKFL